MNADGIFEIRVSEGTEEHTYICKISCSAIETLPVHCPVMLQLDRIHNGLRGLEHKERGSNIVIVLKRLIMGLTIIH